MIKLPHQIESAAVVHLFRIATIALFSLCVLDGARAEGPLYPGQDVQVNPNAAGSGQLLLYPGGKYGRFVPRLREPGEKTGPIKLHMPVKRKVVARPKPETQLASAPIESYSAPIMPEVAPKPQVQKKPPQQRSAPVQAPPEQTDSSETAIPFSFGGPAPLAPPKRAPQRAPQNNVASIAPSQSALASPTEAISANLKRYGQIKFRKGATDIVPAALDGIRQLAGNLNAALDAGGDRVQLDAYGGPSGDKSSDSRRLSLKRALAIRQSLIDAGVPSSRIDVRAMGGAADGGPADRVDVYVRTG